MNRETTREEYEERGEELAACHRTCDVGPGLLRERLVDRLEQLREIRKVIQLGRELQRRVLERLGALANCAHHRTALRAGIVDAVEHRRRLEHLLAKKLAHPLDLVLLGPELLVHLRVLQDFKLELVGVSRIRDQHLCLDAVHLDNELRCDALAHDVALLLRVIDSDLLQL